MAKCSYNPRFAYAWIVMASFVFTDATISKPANHHGLLRRHKSSTSALASGSLAESLPLGFSYANFHDTRWLRQHTSTPFCNYQGRHVVAAQNLRNHFASQSKFLNRGSPSVRNGLQMAASFQDSPVTTRIFCDKTVLGEEGTLSVEPALISIVGSRITEVTSCLFRNIRKTDRIPL